VKTTKRLVLASLLLTMVAPAQALTSLRQATFGMRVQTRYNGSPTFSYESKSFVGTKTENSPASGSSFTYTKQINNTSWYRSYYQERCYELGGTSATCNRPELVNSGFGNAFSNVTINTGVMKAISTNYIDMESPYYDTQSVSVENYLDALNIDKITFSGIAPGSLAVVKITNYAALKTSVNNIIDDPYGFESTNSRFNYVGNSQIFENEFSLRSPTPTAKLSSSWRVCNNSEVVNACGANTLANGFLTSSSLFFVDSDDVLVVNNSLEMYSDASVTYPGNVWASRSALRQISNFGNSAYTIIEMLTPGTSYSSESGDLYPTSIPSPVPEPASWAMLIAGFGLTGGAMRRRRQRLQTVAA
jgi:hypothetical protein